MKKLILTFMACASALLAEHQWTARSADSVDSNRHVALPVRIAIGQQWDNSSKTISIKLVNVSEGKLATFHVFEVGRDKLSVIVVRKRDVPFEIIKNAIVVDIVSGAVILELHGVPTSP